MLAGIVVAGGSLLVAGPGFAIPAFVAGSAAANALIKHRSLSADEYAFATTVFGNSLPARERIVLTNIERPDGRKFTCPSPVGEVFVNLGDAFDDPMQSTAAYPARGKLLIHELAHVWQIHHASFLPGLICEGIANGLTGAPYEPGGSGHPWKDYNLEQQATIVDEWFAPSPRGPSFPYAQRGEHPFYRYIVEDIRGGRFPHRQVTSGSGPSRSVSRTSQHLDVFFVGEDRAIGSVAWEAGVNDNAWSDGFPITKPGAARPDSPLAALARTPLRLDVFFVGEDGAIGSVVWEAGVNGNAWSDGFPVTSPRAARIGSALAVTSRVPPRCDVFFVGSDDAIASVAWELGVDGDAWSRGFPVTKPGAARSDSPLAVLARTPHRLDVFFAGNDGAIGSVAWEAGVNDNAWSDGFPVTKPGAARPNSPLAAVSRTPPRLDVFYVGNDGAIGSVAWEAGVNDNRWSDGFPIVRASAAQV